MFTQLARMVDNREYADVEMLVGEEATPVYAAKVILAARSPVFEALLCGSFREGQPPPSSSSSSSSSSSPSPSVSSSSSVSGSTSLPPVFWHRVVVPDIEPRTMPHLLYWCYTDKLHPDFDEIRSSLTERDLVNLYIAADRYLLDVCTMIVLFTLIVHCGVQSTFDLAFARAPPLACICQRVITAQASNFLCAPEQSGRESKWLAMSPDAAAHLVEGDLEGIEEVDAFRAVQRRYKHHLEEAITECDDGDDHEDRKSTADAVARQKVAGLLKGIRMSLLSDNELSDVVEPSGLLTDTQLAAAYKQVARTHRFVIPELRDAFGSSRHLFDDRVPHGKIVWHLAVEKKAERKKYQIRINLAKRKNITRVPKQVSAKGLSVSVYYNRRCFMRYVADPATLVSVPGVLPVPFSAPDDPRKSGVERVIIIVHVPTTAFS